MKTIDIKCGIYNTEYTLTEHRDGSITVRAPYIKWVNNNGNLAFRNAKFPAGPLAENIRSAFNESTLFLQGYKYDATIGDAVAGYL